jgi:hypothetical protein
MTWRALSISLYNQDSRGVADDLRVMHNIAEHHDFKVLKDVVEWVVESSPNLADAAGLLGPPLAGAGGGGAAAAK